MTIDIKTSSHCDYILKSDKVVAVNKTSHMFGLSYYDLQSV